jgi:hypothetical protein
MDTAKIPSGAGVVEMDADSVSGHGGQIRVVELEEFGMPTIKHGALRTSKSCVRVVLGN